VVPASSLTATIVLATEISSNSPMVIGDLHGAPVYRYSRLLCEDEEWRYVLTRLKEALTVSM
jgi:hypothetical protein